MSLEIEIPVAELKQVLPGLNKVIQKSRLPVLGCVRASVDNGEVKLQATSMEDTATVSMGKCGTGSGSVLMPFEELNKVVKGCLPTDTILLSAKTNEASITYPIGNSRIERKLTFINAQEWPETTVEINEPSIPVTDTLKDALHHALEMSSEDQSRYILQSAFLDMRDPNSHYVVGTNGWVIFSANSFQFSLKESLVVPRRKFLQWKGFMESENWALSSLARVKAVPAAKGKEKVEERPGLVQFKSDRWTFVTRQIEGEYPLWKQAVPTKFKTIVKLANEALQFILSAVPKMPCPDTCNKDIYLVIKGATLSLSAIEKKDDAWTTLEVRDVMIDGPSVTVAMNRNYLIKAMELGLNEIALSDEFTPAIFRRNGRKLVVSLLRQNNPATKSETLAEKDAPTEKVEPASNVQPSQSNEAAPPPTHEAPVNQSGDESAPITTAETQNHERNNSMPEQTAQQETKTTKPEKPQSSYEKLQEMVDGIRGTLKSAVSELNHLSQTVSQAYREKRATDKEIESIRASLTEIRRLKI